MVEVVVEYDYTAKEPDELTIKKGDVIKDVLKKSGGWWEGTLNDKKGMFPDNFVRILNKDVQIPFRNKKDVSRIRQCRVVFSYKQENQDELNLSVGDVIIILGEEEEGWWRGTLNGKEGVFPSNFVEEIRSKPGSKEDLTSTNENDAKCPSLPPKPTKTLCQVIYPYKALNEDELTLKEGDIIALLETDVQDPGWWKGDLNGRVGVFPDNFVMLMSDPSDRKSRTPEPIVGPKLPVVSPQRKSLLEEKEKSDKVEPEVKVTPPVPSKKPLVPVKKSPSSSGSQGGILSGLKKKLVDVVDGASGSKSQPVLLKSSDIKDDLLENAFDQVERSAILSDVRATRVKAPGRRPPSVIFKEGEPGVVNGNMDHTPMDILSEQISHPRPVDIVEQEVELKPKMREWEKHKAPWLEEMKLNQAKRTSTSPGPEQSKLKLTPTEKSAEVEECKSNKVSPFDKPSVSPVDMSKSMSAITSKLKTSPNEIDKNVPLRSKSTQHVPQNTQRPQTMHNITESQMQKVKASPPVPQLKNQKEEKLEDGVVEFSSTQYADVIQRLEKLETVVNQQHQVIEELKGKLQLETDMRRLLQAELDKLSQCVMQV